MVWIETLNSGIINLDRAIRIYVREGKRVEHVQFPFSVCASYAVGDEHGIPYDVEIAAFAEAADAVNFIRQLMGQAPPMPEAPPVEKKAKKAKKAKKK